MKTSAAVGAGALLMRGRAYAGAQSDNLKKFIQPIRSIGGAAGVFNANVQGKIPLAASDGFAPITGVTHYTINIGQFSDQLHPNLPNKTKLWGYGQNGNFTHLGGVIVAQRGSPIQITFVNQLPSTHILPVDTTIPGAETGQAQNRAAVHLHGGFVPWISDGGPFDWFDPSGNHGSSFLNNQVLNPGAKNGQAEYYYPNDQSARLMWYHDHAIGITRLNAYAGIASGYVITDAAELALVPQIPSPVDAKTFYLVFQDKIFVPANISAMDPSWPTIMPASKAGDLWYEHVYNPADLGPAPPLPLPTVSCVPEFFGDTILVNGLVSPFMEVEPRRYRFRMLNACNSRFLNPRLVYAKGPDFPDSTEPSNTAGPAFLQIGNEAGFLPQVALVNAPGTQQLLLAPAERADLIVDFSGVAPGSILLLYADVPAPFPRGDPANDYTPGNPKTPSSIPGFSPNTRTLLQIRVKSGASDAPLMGLTLPPLSPAPLVTQTPGVPIVPVVNPDGTATVTGADGKSQTGKLRQLTLNEDFDAYGRLIQRLGTNVSVHPPSFARNYLDSPATETPSAGDIEIWQIANLTGDTHPIHFHLVNVQMLSRQSFSVRQYTGTPNFTAQPAAPDPNELGWKETVRMNPGEVTTVIMKFDLPAIKTSTGRTIRTPVSPRTGGNEYVWHCHILEHEEHDMMRPLVVT